MPKHHHLLVLTPRADILERVYSSPVPAPATLTVASHPDDFHQISQRFPFTGFVLDADFLGPRTWDTFQEIKIKHPTAFCGFLTGKAPEEGIQSLSAGQGGWHALYPPYPMAVLESLLKKAGKIVLYTAPDASPNGAFGDVSGLLEKLSVQKTASLPDAAAASAKTAALAILHVAHPNTALGAFLRDALRANERGQMLVISDHPAEEAARFAIRNNGWVALAGPQGLALLLDQMQESSVVAAGGKIGPERILVADDEPNILDFIVDILSEHGYEVDGFPSGKAALDGMKKKEYHVALVDFQLGDTTGLALSKELRQIDPDINVILMTAHASLDMAVKAIQADVYDYLIKPVDTNHLKRSIFKALEKRRLALEIKALVADLQKANHQLNRLNDLKSRFLSIVTHDLRTPLTSIKGYAQVLTLQKNIPPDQQAAFLATIAKEADHLGGLINDLMDFVSIEAGKLRIEKAPGAVKEVLDDIQARMAPQAEQRKIRFTVSAKNDLPEVNMDKRRIEQVLTNLIGNAFKHTPADGAVTLEAENREGAVHLTVTDTGEGIPPNDLPRIFEQFYQVEAHASKKEGIGLGLNIAKEIVQAHGGKIGVHSDGPGKGTRFWFTLPSLAAKPS
jgi:signal transduction histidine kinase